MNEPKLTYLGSLPKATDAPRSSNRDRLRAIWPFLVVVVAPTILAMVYYLLIATPRYVSESQFIVRAADESRTNSLGFALEGVGLGATQNQAYSVHRYMTSRDGFGDLKRRFDLTEMLGRADVISRYPRPGEKLTDESFYKAFQRFTVVGYDSTSGISTLRVEAFRAQDAQRLNDALLAGGENLVNRLNERAAADAIKDAVKAQADARARLADVQARLTQFRNREQFLDPAATAEERSRLIGSLLATAAELRAERSQLARSAPASPQLEVLDGRIRAYDAQVAQERGRIAGAPDSLAPKLSAYENLTLERELADRELASASTALVAAQQEARRQKLYLDRIVTPSLPDAAIEPRRFLSILIVLMSALVAYGIGWFIWVGAREHGQAG